MWTKVKDVLVNAIYLPQKILTRTRQEVKAIYTGRLWRDEVRPEQLRRFPYCQYCEEQGETPTLAVQVDHIVPLVDGGDPYDYDNLKSTCFRCHVIKTAEENRQRAKAKKAAGKPLRPYW